MEVWWHYPESRSSIHVCSLSLSLSLSLQIFLLVDSALEARTRKLERWFSTGGILFVGYELFRNMVMGKRLRKKKKEAFEKFLLDPGLYSFNSQTFSIS